MPIRISGLALVGRATRWTWPGTSAGRWKYVAVIAGGFMATDAAAATSRNSDDHFKLDERQGDDAEGGSGVEPTGFGLAGRRTPPRSAA
jgi:hypothetical protein